MGARQFGARVPRVEDPALLTGRARFVDDVKLAGVLHAAFVRSPHAHARVGAIDASAALAMPGVHAVLTIADMPGRLATEPLPMPVPNPAITALRTQHALARGEVCYVGEAVAVVIAESRYLAEDAVAAIAVDYEVLPAVSDCRDALAPGAPASHSDLAGNIAAFVPMAYGDVEHAFATAAHVFEEDIFQHRGGAMTLEGRAVLARQEPASGVLTVWSATQTPHICRATIADLLDRNPEDVRVIAPFVGGGFGTKAPFYPEEIVIPVAALQIGRPVKWIEDRREHFLSSTQERDQYWKVAIAVDRDGKILGLRGTMIHDNGAYLPWGIIAPYIASTTFPGPYVVPAFKFETTVVLTNRVPTTVVRGAGRPQAVFATERLMDRVARALAIDRAELRRRNMITPAQMPYHVGLVFRDGKPLVYASGDFPLSQTRAMALADYDGFRARQAAARKAGRYIGIGIGNYVEGTGLGPYEGVTIRILRNGKVAVATGATTQGQGTHTTLSQIVADRLGCGIADIVMTLGDTAAISQGVGAFASRQAINAGSSAMIAGDTVRQQVVALAAKSLGVPESEIDVEDGRAIARTGNRPTLSFAELAKLAQGMPGFSMAPGQTPGLEHTAWFTPPQASYCNGTHIVEVEVDPETGGVHILNYVVGHDSGVVINPMIVDGQVQGGVAHGIGNALLEFMRYDTDAQPLTTSFADYLMPTAPEVPGCIVEHVETPNPLNPLGVKGAGEGGTIPAPAAIIAAIEDALSPFGVHFAEMPLTPARIVAALRDAGAYDKPSKEFAMTTITSSRDGAVAIVTIDKAAQGNLLTVEDLRELAAAIRAAGATDARVIVLRTIGADFCRGRAPGATPPPTAMKVRANVCEPILDVYDALAGVPQPVVARVQGAALGFGAAMAGACDLTIAADNARFQLPEMQRDLPPTLAISALMARVPRKALTHLVYSMEEIDATTALQFGIVSQVVPLADLDAALAKLLATMTARSPEALVAVKDFFRAAPYMDPRGCADYAGNLLAAVLSSAGK